MRRPKISPNVQQSHQPDDVLFVPRRDGSPEHDSMIDDSYGFTIQLDDVDAALSQSWLTRTNSVHISPVIVEDNSDGGDKVPEVCPNYLHAVDQMLSKDDGSPTILYWVCILSCAIQAPHFLIGTAVTPGIIQTLNDSEASELTVVFIMCYVVFFVGLTYALACKYNVRAAIRPDGPLVELGAGTKLLAPEYIKMIKRYNMLLSPFRPLGLAVPVSFAMVLSTLGVLGVGLHSSAYNRVSQFVTVMFALFVIPLAFCWVLSLQVAVTLTKSAIGEVDKGISLQKVSSDDWTQDVATPIRKIATITIPLLSKGWGHVQAMIVAVCVFAALGMSCLSVSPSFYVLLRTVAFKDFSQANSDTAIAVIRVTLYVLLAVIIYIPIYCATGPAEASTRCQYLLDRLNRIRMSTLTPEVHDRLLILETAISKLNTGQGMGFLVGMTLVDRAKLTKFARGLVSLFTVLIPILIKMQNIETQAASVGFEKCALTNPQVSTIQSVMTTDSGHIGHKGCEDGYENITLADILMCSTHPDRC